MDGVLLPVGVEGDVGGGHGNLRARLVLLFAARREGPAVEDVAGSRHGLARRRTVGQDHRGARSVLDRVGERRVQGAAVTAQGDFVVPLGPGRRQHKAVCRNDEVGQVGRAVERAVGGEPALEDPGIVALALGQDERAVAEHIHHGSVECRDVADLCAGALAACRVGGPVAVVAPAVGHGCELLPEGRHRGDTCRDDLAQAVVVVR